MTSLEEKEKLTIKIKNQTKELDDLNIGHLNLLKNENFSKSTLDISIENNQVEEHEKNEFISEMNCNGENLILNLNEDFSRSMQRCFLYWVEHLPAQKNIY